MASLGFSSSVLVIEMSTIFTQQTRPGSLRSMEGSMKFRVAWLPKRSQKGLMNSAFLYFFMLFWFNSLLEFLDMVDIRLFF